MIILKTKLMRKLHFLNGRLHGSFEKFNENEQLIEEGEFYLQLIWENGIIMMI